MRAPRRPEHSLLGGQRLRPARHRNDGRRRHPGRARSGAPGDGPPTAASHWVSSGSYFTCAIIDDGTVRCWGENSYGELGIEGTDRIGNNAGEMGSEMSVTDLHMVPEDFDGDGWIDLWDTDDDNDGHLDTQDDLPFDPRDWIDDDADGIGVNVDTDDDDPTVTTEGEDTADKWSDAEEEECGTLPWSSLSQPEDADGDGICDAIDEDVDGNGWNDTYQCLCAREDDSGNWSRERVFGPLQQRPPVLEQRGRAKRVRLRALQLRNKVLHHLQQRLRLNGDGKARWKCPLDPICHLRQQPSGLLQHGQAEPDHVRRDGERYLQVRRHERQQSVGHQRLLAL